MLGGWTLGLTVGIQSSTRAAGLPIRTGFTGPALCRAIGEVFGPPEVAAKVDKQRLTTKGDAPDLGIPFIQRSGFPLTPIKCFLRLGFVLAKHLARRDAPALRGA